MHAVYAVHSLLHGRHVHFSCSNATMRVSISVSRARALNRARHETISTIVIAKSLCESEATIAYDLTLIDATLAHGLVLCTVRSTLKGIGRYVINRLLLNKIFDANFANLSVKEIRITNNRHVIRKAIKDGMI